MSYNINTSTRYDKASESTAENIREMEELLPPILRKHGAVDAKDGDSVVVLYVGVKIEYYIFLA